MLTIVAVLFLVISTIVKLFVVFSKKRCESKVSMAGKVVIVTGANSGIGFETAKDLAGRGARVILACRSEARALAARDRIVGDAPGADVVYKQLDLSSLASVRRFAHDVCLTETRLDVLVNNAGVVVPCDRHSADGIILDMQINYFGPLLLTLLLLPLLKKTKSSRIVNLSSTLHYFGRISFKLINKEGHYWDWFRYANSKLCMMLFTVELARRLEGAGVTVNAVHPGIIRTNLVQKSHWFPRLIFDYLCFTCSRNVVEGAQTTIYLAVAEECANTSGKYFVDCRETYMNLKAHDHELAEKLWNYSKAIVGFED